MKNLDKALDSLKFDSRMVEWNVQNGVITNEQLQTHLSQLKDMSPQIEKLEFNEDSLYDDNEE